ncbi:hypothetical protein PHYBLDRAFT_69229 [Phycomyces blakesleeanus NRRL 1555(-)]|uniref:Uncharacterized protein n=1 Tax=Phycomyces blakesleeanus (strain ATCC 8743b / DSM 1359 / FGSC 10004 / NBRC 33097 / NRRL 1555) TaxID=763407 RepID=A0A167KI35_PHYB8|nr:hypothetical protein PHYBLDRAFT_69229 [Phycomyces blakesleeanus NRRL 1555(-)]OAD68156.1 hypothetical protein PHYBLDRAFT_69229 [Phycomyces blakesleeanus NRRL 1555(-)]|eukprot:XP_018286196.1 hypothetical protein PHYBLDRAFT_69229 [Phycomyces blakesleeanus NRRL 1555(-)]
MYMYYSARKTSILFFFIQLLELKYAQFDSDTSNLKYRLQCSYYGIYPTIKTFQKVTVSIIDLIFGKLGDKFMSPEYYIDTIMSTELYQSSIVPHSVRLEGLGIYFSWSYRPQANDQNLEKTTVVVDFVACYEINTQKLYAFYILPLGL